MLSCRVALQEEEEEEAAAAAAAAAAVAAEAAAALAAANPWQTQLPAASCSSVRDADSGATVQLRDDLIMRVCYPDGSVLMQVRLQVAR